MKDSFNHYLEYLDMVLDNIPKRDKMLLKELVYNSYGLIDSDNVLVDIQYLDYLFCYMLNRKYINYDMFLSLGKELETIVYGLKVRDNF